MKKEGNIDNIDALQREIYRLRMKAKNIELKLEHHFDHFRMNFSALCINSFYNKEETTTSSHSFKKNGKLNSLFSKISDRIADQAVGSLDKLLDKLFHDNK